MGVDCQQCGVAVYDIQGSYRAVMADFARLLFMCIVYIIDDTCHQCGCMCGSWKVRISVSQPCGYHTASFSRPTMCARGIRLLHGYFMFQSTDGDQLRLEEWTHYTPTRWRGVLSPEQTNIPVKCVHVFLELMSYHCSWGLSAWTISWFKKLKLKTKDEIISLKLVKSFLSMSS